MNCFNEKNQHIGRLEELEWFDTGWDCEASVKWCPKCGAVVIDRTTDGRRMGCYVNMKFPEITRKALKNGKRKSRNADRRS